MRVHILIACEVGELVGADSGGCAVGGLLVYCDGGVDAEKSMGVFHHKKKGESVQLKRDATKDEPVLRLCYDNYVVPKK